MMILQIFNSAMELIYDFWGCLKEFFLSAALCPGVFTAAQLLPLSIKTKTIATKTQRPENSQISF
jgi:hypothetical protein